MNKDEAIKLLRGIEAEINTIIIGQEQMPVAVHCNSEATMTGERLHRLRCHSNPST